jgi:hypothetical protein
MIPDHESFEIVSKGSVQGPGGLQPSVGVSLDGEVKLLVHLSPLLGREVCQGFDGPFLVSF